jgi:hypothetical protein
LVTDTQVTASTVPDLSQVQAILPKQLAVLAAFDLALLAAPQETSPPLLPALVLSTVLRI